MFWLTNWSEFLHFVKCDRDLSVLISPPLQMRIMEILKQCFELTVNACIAQLQPYLSTFVNVKDGDDGEGSRNIVRVLKEIVGVTRHFNLNAAIIVQIFSHLFHFINAYSFNWLVSATGWSFLEF